MNGVVHTEEQHLPHPVRGLEPLGGARVVEVPEPARRVAHVRRLQRHQRQVEEQRLASVVLPDNLPRLLQLYSMFHRSSLRTIISPLHTYLVRIFGDILC